MPTSLSQTLLTGVYRTGTEYLTQLLDGHPAISATMYRVNVLRFIYGEFDPISEVSNQKKALNALNERMQQRYKLAIDLEAVLKKLNAIPIVGYGEFYDVVMSTLYLSGDVRHWIEKNQLLWREIPIFLDMMPNGRAILLIRDPRSVLASFKKFTIAPPPAYLGAIFNCVDSMKWSKELSHSKYQNRFLSLRYEDIARAPEESLNSIWRFLQIPVPKAYEKVNRKDAYGNDWHHNSAFHSPTNSNFDVESAISRWRTVLSKEEVALSEMICGEWMQDFGYELSTQSGAGAHLLELFSEDATLLSYYEHWQKTGNGIEAFPTDPRNPTNWGS